jgi:MFS family permease
MFSSITANVRLVPRYGARLLVPTGMLFGCAGMVYLTGLGAHSNYASQILPSLLMMGLGFGLIFAPSIQTATLGVKTSDSGVASAMVNVSQQVGGSIGTALLSTIAVTATASFAAAHSGTPGLTAQAAVHGYTSAFAWSAAIFALAAVITALLLRPGSKVPMPAAEAMPAGESGLTA